MASRAKSFAGNKSASSTRPSRLRAMRPKVEQVTRSPRRGRPKQQQYQQGADNDNLGVKPARYHCAFQDEVHDGEFGPPQLVWCKVRSHPWWPAQVFDAADASELALQHVRPGAPLVAYFWDKTFAWSDASALLPFRTNFARLASQSTVFNFVSAVDAALQEVGRRVEAGLSCACSAAAAKKQEIANSGIREGAYGAVVDGAYTRDMLRGKPFLDYISALGINPLAGTDRLDLVTAKAQLSSFNRLRGQRDLPEFVIYQGIEDVAPHTKMKRRGKSAGVDVPSKKKLRHGESLSRKREVSPEPAKKEAMDEDSSMPSRRAAEDTLSKERKSKISKSSARKKKDTSKDADNIEAIPECANKEVTDEGSSMLSGGVAADTLNKKRNSNIIKSSARKKKKKEDTSKDADRFEAVGDCKMSIKKSVDGVLVESKSGRKLRSTHKMKEALEGLKGLGNYGGGKTIKGKDKNAALPKEKNLGCRPSSARKNDNITEDGDGLADCASPGKKRLGRCVNSVTKNVPVSISEHGRKKKKLSELMTETPNPAPGGKSKSRGKHSMPVSAEKLENPDRDMDTVKTRKRKKLDTLGDLSSQADYLSPNKSTKAREVTHKAARQKSQASPVIKANGGASQTRSSRAKNTQVTVSDDSPYTMKLNSGKKDPLPQDPRSCGEMLSQLYLAAHDLKKIGKIRPASVSFFTDFRKSLGASNSDAKEEITEKATNAEYNASSSPADVDVPEKATNAEASPSEPPLADHMKDDYWADILINVEEPLSSIRKKKNKGKSMTSKTEVSACLENSEVTRGGGKQDSANGKQQADVETTASITNEAPSNVEETENPLLAGLVLHFSRPGAVPSCSDLIKIFSQYGPVKEAKTEVANRGNCAQVIFKRRMDAEAAFGGAAKMSALGPALVSFRISDFPSSCLRNKPQQEE